MARPKAKTVPVRLEIHYERGGDADLKRALAVLAAMLRDCANDGARTEKRGNFLPGPIVYREESLR
jgi:hypothetical protein